MRKHAIDKITATNLYGQKHAGIRAAGAHGIANRTGVKDDAFAGIEIGCGHAERDAHFFECLHLQGTSEEGDHAVVRSEAAAREGPAGEGGKSRVVRHLLHLVDREAAAVAGPDQGSHAGSSDDADGNAFFFEDLENSDVGDAAGETSAKRNANGWNARGNDGGSFAR